MYGGLLDLDEWKERYSDLQRQLDVSNFLLQKALVLAVLVPTLLSITQAIKAPQELQEVEEDNQETDAHNETTITAENSKEQPVEPSEDVEMEEANTMDDTVNEPSAESEASAAASASQPANAPVNSVVSADEFHRLTLAHRFNADAIKFINQIHTAIPYICLLLASKSKIEVLEAMDFFVVAWNYKIEASAVSNTIQDQIRYTIADVAFIPRRESKKCHT
jgi:condensin complex subunit 1